MHKSKGLQYPIVFCPFCWNTGGGGQTGDVIFHDAKQSGKLVMDIGSNDQEAHKRIAERENLAENARLLYVALTRAEYRCVVVWGSIRDAGESALARLLHPPKGLEAGSWVEDTGTHFERLSDEDIVRDLQQLARGGRTGISVETVPSPTQQVYTPPARPPVTLACRTLSREIPRGSSTASFSSLIAAHASGSGAARPRFSVAARRRGGSAALAVITRSKFSGFSAGPEGGYGTP